MTNYTVEAVTAPVLDGNWSVLRDVLEAVPGALLIEDAEEPRLIVPVEANEPMRAATFLDGVSQVMGFKILRGSIYETPEQDFESFDDEEDSGETPVEARVQAWVNDIPPVPVGAR